MQRVPLIAGNWKMHNTVADSLTLVKDLVTQLPSLEGVDVLLCPPFTALYAVRQAIGCVDIQLGAQDVYWEPQGAFTGEISASMLKEVGCGYVIIGHSERRQYFAETNADANQKVKAVLQAGMKPILCVGETLEQREAGQTESHIANQVSEGLQGLTGAEMKNVVLAYEPIWAIGTGRSATSKQANDVVGFIRRTVRRLLGEQAADIVRVLYGGSVKPATIRELMFEPDIDGVLVGGASLKADEFAKIVNF